MENLVARHVENIDDLNEQEYYGFHQSDERLYFDEPFESDSEIFNGENKTTVASMTSKEPSEQFNKHTPTVRKNAQLHKVPNKNKKGCTQKASSSLSKIHNGALVPGNVKSRRDLSLPANQIGVCMEVWEANQHLVAKLRSENEQLRRELQVNKVELKTVQRECKVQGVRLTKAIGKEASMPVLVDRLQAEVRSLQIQLRRKSEQADVSDRKVVDLEQRLLPLLEIKERESKNQQQSGQPEEQTSRKQFQIIESQKMALEKETKLTSELRKKIDLLERTSKYEQGAAMEQVRQFRRIINDLQTQVDSANRQLQEKTKLLELQNIYSQRLPKSVCAMASSTKSKQSPPNFEAHQKCRTGRKLSFSKLSERVREQSISSERLDKEFDQVFNRRYINFRQQQQQQHDPNNCDSPRFNNNEQHDILLNEVGISGSSKKHSSRRSLTKKDKSSFNRYQSDEAEEKTASEGILGKVLKHQSRLKESRDYEDRLIKTPIPASRKQKNTKIEKTVTITEPTSTFSNKVDMFESSESFEYNKKCTRWRPLPEDDETVKTPTASENSQSVNNTSPNLEALQAELSRITERHEVLKTEAASKCKTVVGGNLQAANILESVKRRKPEVVTTIPINYEPDAVVANFAATENPTPEEPDRFEMCKEDRLWEDLFGKDSDDLSGMLASPISHYPPLDNEDKSRSKYTIQTSKRDGVTSSSESGKKTRGRQPSGVSRRNPFEDLDVEEVPL